MATEDPASHEGEELVRFERADAYKAKQEQFLYLLTQESGDPAPLLRELVSEVRCASHRRSTCTRSRPTSLTRTSSHSLCRPPMH